MRIALNKAFALIGLGVCGLTATLTLTGCEGCGGPPPIEPAAVPEQKAAPATESPEAAPAGSEGAAKTEGGSASAFPSDRSLGTLKYYDAETFKWVEIGEAKDSPALPPGRNITLTVSAEGAKDLSPLAKLPPDTLKAITLDDLTLADDQIAHVTALKGLTKISLRNAKISDAAVAQLATLPKLQEIDFAMSEFADTGVAALVTALALQTLDISYTKVTDAAVENIAKIASLSYLDPQRSAITEAGEAKLAELRPELTVVKR